MDLNGKITIKTNISARDKGIRALQKEYLEFKKILIPKVQEVVRDVIKDKEIKVMAQQKWMVDQHLTRYIKSLLFHPMPFHRQSVKIEKIENNGNNGNKPEYYIWFKTKEDGGTRCRLIVPKKYRNLIDLASGGDYGENPHLGQVEIIEDNQGRFNTHITIRYKLPEPYEPKGWIGVDVGWKKLACSIYCGSDGIIKDPTIHGKELKQRILQIKYNLKNHQRAKRNTDIWDNRLQNTIKYATGVVAKEIVKKAKKYKAGVVMERLSFRAHTKRYLIPRYKLMVAIRTLCERSGVPFMLVDAKYTSQKCIRCGYIDKKNRNGSRFTCLRCGYQADADILAAMNIGRAAMDIGLAPISKGEPDLSGEPGEVATPQARLDAFQLNACARCTPGKAGIQYTLVGLVASGDTGNSGGEGSIYENNEKS